MAAFNIDPTSLSVRLSQAQRDARTMRRGRDLEAERATISVSQDQRGAHRDLGRVLVRGPESAAVFASEDRSGLVRLERGPLGALVQRTLTIPEARLLLHESAAIVEDGKGGEDRPARLSSDLVTAAIAQAARTAPRLLRIARMPELQGDRIVAEPGYDAATSVYYDLSDGIVVPETATQADAEAAVAGLRGLYRESAFEDGEIDFAGALALLLTPVVKAEVGLTPGCIITANGPSVGKTTLGRSAVLALTGEMGGIDSGFTTDKYGQQQWVASVLSPASVQPITLVDNVAKGSEIHGDTISGAHTTPRIGVRPLGSNTAYLSLAVDTCFVFTGNNVSAGEDMRRRVYTIRMSWPGIASERQFQGDLLGEVRARRSEILADILTILQAWLNAGQPAPTSTRPMHSYESWHRVVAGALDYAGVEGFLARLEEEQRTMDVETDLWVEHLRLLRQIFGDGSFTTRDAHEALRQDEDHDSDTLPMPPGVGNGTVGNLAQRLGLAYRKANQRFIAGYVLEATDATRGGTRLWRVRDLAVEREAQEAAA